MIVQLDRASLVHPLGDMGDRQIQGISTVIASEEWLVEADYHNGRIGDVHVYRNANYPQKVEANWQWYAAIPTANIKAYRLSEGHRPSAQQKATAQEPSRSGTSARA